MKKIKFLMPVMLAATILPTIAITSCSKEKNYNGPLDIKLNADKSGIVINGFKNPQEYDKKLEIPEFAYINNKKYPVVEISQSAFEGCDALEEAIIPNVVTVIGASAFRNCTKLSTISFSQKIEAIPERLFEGCALLRKFVIPASVKTIGQYAFASCNGMTNMVVDPANTEFTSRDSDGNESNCIIKLEPTDKQIIQGWNGQIPNGATSIGKRAFAYSRISALSIPDTIKLIDEEAFYRCNDLTQITFNNPDSSQLIEVGMRAFVDCGKLTSFNAPKNLQIIEANAFYNCSKLENVVFDDKLERIGNGSFNHCNLQAITIPKAVSKIGYAPFSYNPSLSNITVASENQTYTSTDGNNEECHCIMTKDHQKIIQGSSTTTIPVTIRNSVKIICDSSFANINIENFTFPLGLEKIEDSAFYETKLQAFSLPDSLAYIGDDAFKRCQEIRNVAIGANVNVLKQTAFNECINLQTITVDPANQTYTSTDGNNAECNCIMTKNRKSLIQGCGSVSSPTILDSITTICDEAFFGFEGITTLALPANLGSIGNRAFYECPITNLTFNNTHDAWKWVSQGNEWNDGMIASVIHCTDGDYPI